MKNPLEILSEIEYVIRLLQKTETLLVSGKEILAYREHRKLVAYFENIKRELIEGEKTKENSEPVEDEE